MPHGMPKPTFKSFVKSSRWNISQFMLRQVGSARHDIRFVLPSTGAIEVKWKRDYFDEHAGANFIKRFVNFSEIGVLCSSGTSPSLREIVFSATISNESPIFFGMNTLLRTGFPEKDEFGIGKVYIHRVDFTKVENSESNLASLLVLGPGCVHYPLRVARAGLFHQALCDLYRDQFYAKTPSLSMYSPQDQAEISEAYRLLPTMVTLDIAVVLDSEELLAFHWNAESGRFDEAFYNSGITKAP